MDNYYSKHYITVDDQGRITDGWSNGPYPDKDTAGAICINDQGGYQFRLFSGGEENPALWTMGGVPLYKWMDGKAVARTEKEIAADRVDISAHPPTAQERLEAQVTYTAMMTDTLMEGEALDV